MDDNLKRKLIVLKTFKNIKKNIDINFIDKWILVLEEFYPNLWDIQFRENNIYFIILYPEITIKNSLNLSHTIYNLYVRILYDTAKEDFYLSGMRPLLYLNDNGYKHSHLDPHNDDRYTSFCLGSGTTLSISLNGGELKREKNNENYLKLFFHSLNSYLEWESIEGGPYQRMSQYLYGRDDNDRKIFTFKTKEVLFIYNNIINDIKINFNLYVFERNILKNQMEIICNDYLINFIRNLIITNKLQNIYLGKMIEDKFYSVTEFQKKILNNENIKLYQTDNLFKNEYILGGCIINSQKIEKNDFTSLEYNLLEINNALLNFIIYKLNTYINEQYTIRSKEIISTIDFR